MILPFCERKNEVKIRPTRKKKWHKVAESTFPSISSFILFLPWKPKRVSLEKQTFFFSFQEWKYYLYMIPIYLLDGKMWNSTVRTKLDSNRLLRKLFGNKFFASDSIFYLFYFVRAEIKGLQSFYQSFIFTYDFMQKYYLQSRTDLRCTDFIQLHTEISVNGKSI